jgi:AbrB family looped-hinge helix DNA binding protein
MALLRVFSELDEKNKIAIPRGIRKELNIKPGDGLELMLGGINKARKLIISKTKGRHIK